MRNVAVQYVLQKWYPILQLNPSRFTELGVSIPIPTFEESIINEVAYEAQTVFSRRNVVLHLEGNFYFVGDIHGNIFDLVRILCHVGMPPDARYIFLGDYVDRGEYSVEVVTLLFALTATYPNNFFMLRGNHEFDNLNRNYGFYNEVIASYKNDSVYNSINDAFMWMPLVAIVNKKIFAVHGGISPDLTNLAQLTKLRRPILANSSEIVSDITWSDPETCVRKKEVNKSNRGLGITFGVQALKNFLDKFKCTVMIRAHQCVDAGIAVFGEGLLYTVFSCSNYVEFLENKCGIIYFPVEGRMVPIQFPVHHQIPRSNAIMTQCIKDENETMTTQRNSLTLNMKILIEKPRVQRYIARSKSVNASHATPLVVPDLKSISYSDVRPKNVLRRSLSEALLS